MPPPVPVPTHTLPLHVKVVWEPPNGMTPAAMVAATQEVFGAVGISVVQRTYEKLALQLLEDLDITAPTITGTITAEQEQLFACRNNAPRDEICAYFVRTTHLSRSGAASLRPSSDAFPNGRPSVVVACAPASEWTLAHECGHVLGLSHVTPEDRLMMERTWKINTRPPALTPAEVNTVKASPFTY